MKNITDQILLFPTKCPNCGGNINVSPKTKKAVCEYCGQSFIVDYSGSQREKDIQKSKNSYTDVSVGDSINPHRKYRSYTDYNHTYYDLRVEGNLIDIEAIRENPKESYIYYDELDLKNGKGIDWDNVPYNALELFLDAQTSSPLLYVDQIPDCVLIYANLSPQDFDTYFDNLFERHPELEYLEDEEGKDGLIRSIRLKSSNSTYHNNNLEQDRKLLLHEESWRYKGISKKNVVIALIAIILIFVLFTGTENGKVEEQPKSPEVQQESNEQIEYSYDSLQELYVNCPLNYNYFEMLVYIEESGLPYSEKKYNGSRCFQISTDKSGVAQSYNKSHLPYIRISYKYPKGENSVNDDLRKYTFSDIRYYPRTNLFEFTTNESGHCSASEAATSIYAGETREEQIEYYYKYLQENQDS